MAMTELQTAAIAEIWKPVPREGTFDERFEAFLDQRIRLHEFISPTRRAAIVWAVDSEVIDEGVNLVRRLMRREVERVFDPELGDAPDRLAAVEAAAGWSFWNNLRAHQGLSEEEATAALRLTLESLFRR